MRSEEKQVKKEERDVNKIFHDCRLLKQFVCKIVSFCHQIFLMMVIIVMKKFRFTSRFGHLIWAYLTNRLSTQKIEFILYIFPALDP